MIDWEQKTRDDKTFQDRQEAAKASGHAITIHIEQGESWRNLIIEANHPVRVDVLNIPEDMGYEMSGGAVDCFPGECPVGMVSIEDLAKQGITELTMTADDGTMIVVPIPEWKGPNA